MKHTVLVIAAAALVTAACKKTGDTGPSQGVNFNRLLKTVTTDNTLNSEMTVTYNYDNNNQLANTILQTAGGAGGSARGKETETFYRNAGGRLDSTVTVVEVNGILTPSSKNIFRYNGAGQLITSVYSSGPRRDSCVYTYSGNVLQQRLDYNSSNGGPFSAFLEVKYSFDAAGNPTRIIFHWAGATSRTDTLNITYDSRFNPLPVDRFFFPYWTYVFFNDFTPPANPLTLTLGAEVQRNEYSYAPDGKPLYRKQTFPNTNPQQVLETWYYYD